MATGKDKWQSTAAMTPATKSGTSTNSTLKKGTEEKYIMLKVKQESGKNLIFQYMILNPDLDEKRGPILGRSRTQVYSDVADISRRSFEIYAEKVGADYIYSDEAVYTKDDIDRDNSVPLFECLRVIYDVDWDEYDKILFVDTDIVANTDENIFEQCGAEVFGVLESDIRTHKGGGYNSWDYKESTYNDIVEKYSYHDVPVVPAMPPNTPSKVTIMNTGVVCWTREGRLYARENFDDWKWWFFEGPQKHMSIMNDQPYLSGQFQKYDMDVGTLDQTWNDSPHYETEDEFFEKAKFCHYTGGEWKVLMLEHYRDGKFKIFDSPV